MKENFIRAEIQLSKAYRLRVTMKETYCKFEILSSSHYNTVCAKLRRHTSLFNYIKSAGKFFIELVDLFVDDMWLKPSINVLFKPDDVDTIFGFNILLEIDRSTGCLRYHVMSETTILENLVPTIWSKKNGTPVFQSSNIICYWDAVTAISW